MFIGKVYYRTVKPVPADHELLVWYGESYARDLGILPGQELTVYQIHRNPGELMLRFPLISLLLSSYPASAHLDFPVVMKLIIQLRTPVYTRIQLKNQLDKPQIPPL